MTTSSQYRELTLEFFTTYEVAIGFSDVNTQTISFRMRGQHYAMSSSEFALHVGTYTDDELPRRIDSRVSMSDLEQTQLWHQLTEKGLYDATTYKASNIHEPRIQIPHRLIATTFYGHLECIGKGTYGDLNIINILLSSQFLCPARMLAEELSKMAGKFANQAIVGGTFIIRLAHGLGVDTEGMTMVGRNIELSLQTLRNMKVVGSDRRRSFLLTKSVQ